MNSLITPYREEEVKFQSAGIIFAGTLTVPKEFTSHPAVVLISGWSPSKRDYEIRGMKIFKIIADHLARNGIASLRYDERGVGGSTGSDKPQYNFDHLSDEVLAAAKFLQNRSDINPNQVGLIGHSLGACIASMAASYSKEIAFIIPMAGHGLKGEETGVITRKYFGRVSGETDEELEIHLDLLKQLFSAIQTGEGWEEASAAVLNKAMKEFERLSENQRKRFSNVNNYLKSTYEGFVLSQGRTPMYKFFLNYDPTIAMKKVTCPVLALFGELDIIHPPDQHKEKILEALKEGNNQDVIVKTFAKTTHDFITEESIKEKDFTPGFLEEITDWILERVDVVK